MNRLAPPVFAFRADGSGMDLAAPRADEINFRAMAGQLARLPRFNALPFSGSYSFAQHAVHGAEAMLREGVQEMIAGLLFLKTAHVAFIGDVTLPTIELAATMMAKRHGEEEATHFLETLADMQAGWVTAIYDAAGLPPPSAWRRSWAATVEGMEGRLTMTEAVELFGGVSSKWPGALKGHARPSIAGTINPWPAAKAEFEWLAMLERLIGRERVADSGLVARVFQPLSAANTSTAARRKTR